MPPGWENGGDELVQTCHAPFDVRWLSYIRCVARYCLQGNKKGGWVSPIRQLDLIYYEEKSGETFLLSGGHLVSEQAPCAILFTQSFLQFVLR